MSTPLWRPRWVGLVALLRAVGHVLDKADGECGSATTRRVIDSEWQGLKESKPDPSIFWNFIEDERNNSLKAYKIGSAINITIRPGTAVINLSTGEVSDSLGGSTTFEAFMRSGPFRKEDPLQLCQAAIQFWHNYLDRIDQKVLEAESG
jgi:hypothetical protein